LDSPINNWIKLIEHDEYKQVIVNSLKILNDRGKIDVFGIRYHTQSYTLDLVNQ
jgi:hypothetical protein